jgi:hypothetical protein
MSVILVIMYVGNVMMPQLAHYVFTTLQFGCCLVRSLSYVKITLQQRILDT